MKKDILKDLVIIAEDLDAKGLMKEADDVTNIIKKIAMGVSPRELGKDYYNDLTFNGVSIGAILDSSNISEGAKEAFERYGIPSTGETQQEFSAGVEEEAKKEFGGMEMDEILDKIASNK